MVPSPLLPQRVAIHEVQPSIETCATTRASGIGVAAGRGVVVGMVGLVASATSADRIWAIPIELRAYTIDVETRVLTILN